MSDYSTQELMIIAAAREIADEEVVFVGMRLPITAYGVARLTHAPDAVGLFEGGLVRGAPADDMLYTMVEPPNQLGAAWATGLVQVMGLLGAGRVDAGFVGGAEVDKFGNLNSSYIGDHASPEVKLPGSGGAADLAALSKRLIAIINHDERRLVERVSYVTSVGHLTGGEARKKAGLPWGGTAGVITDKAILRPHGPENELHLAAIHPGHTQAEIAELTGWALKAAPDLRETEPPSEAEMAALHKIDTDGFWR